MFPPLFLAFVSRDVVSKVKFATDFLPLLPEFINSWFMVRYLQVVRDTAEHTIIEATVCANDTSSHT